MTRLFACLVLICLCGAATPAAAQPIPFDRTGCDDGDAIVFDAKIGGLRCIKPPPAPAKEPEKAEAPAPCGSDPAPGDKCTDGTVYAGVSPDGDALMYTTPADAPGTFFWNDGSEFDFSDTKMENCTTESPGEQSSCWTGAANTALLMKIADPSAPYAAASYCDSLKAFGHDDWYLPAADELNVLFINRTLIGGFDTSGAWYWTSSESNSSTARMQRFIVGGQDYGNKDSLDHVRCVRK